MLIVMMVASGDNRSRKYTKGMTEWLSQFHIAQYGFQDFTEESKITSTILVYGVERSEHILLH